MLRGKINAEAPVCEIRLALPWPVAAYIAEHGEEIVATIQAAIGYRENVVARRERAAELDAERMKATRRRWRILARVALRELRQHHATTPEARATVLRALAALTGDMTAPALDLLATRRARELREKIRARRDRLIARLYLAGRTNAQIQSELRRFRYSGTSVALISEILCRVRGERRLPARSAKARTVAGRSLDDVSPLAIAGAGDGSKLQRRHVAGRLARLASLSAGEDPRKPASDDPSPRDPGDVSPAARGEPSPGSRRRPRARGGAR